MAGNPSFDGDLAYLIDKQASRKWSTIWGVAHPFLQKIKSDELNYNAVTESPDGNSLLWPIQFQGPATSARIGTNANAYTPVTPYAPRGDTQAQYYFARFENGIYLNPTQLTQIRNSAGGNTRVPILPSKVDQCMEDFKNVETTEFFGTQNGTGAGGTGSVTGLRYFASTSNSPGGISQTTYTNWAATLNSSVGVLNEGIFDGQIHRINALGRGPADYMQLSYASDNDVYGKFVAMFAGSQLIVDQGKSVKYGFTVFNYRGLDVFMDNGLGTAVSGSMCIGRSSAWYLSMKTENPERVDELRLPGTGSHEIWYQHWLTWGCNDVGSLFYGTNVS